VANQVQTRLVPPATTAGNTTLPGSRRMSGQLNVEDNTVAATANATAPTTNKIPVVLRRRSLVLSVTIPVSFRHVTRLRARQVRYLPQPESETV
jgi:hypothetical protein